MDSRDHFYGFSLLFNIFAEKNTYYAGIMLDAPSILLCSKLCRHNVSDPTFFKTLTGDQIFEVDSFLKSFCQNYNFAFDKSHSNDFLQVLEILPVKKGRWLAVKY